MRWRRRPEVLVVEPSPEVLRLAAREAAYDALRETSRDDLPTSAILGTYLRQVGA